MTRLAALALVALAAAAVVAVWRIAPAAAPPIYDGVCTSAPYVTLGSSPPPSSVSKTYPAAAPGAFQTSELVTNENPPQAQVLMTDGTFVSSVPFTLSITPVPPPAQKPNDGSIDGNVYRITATAVNGQQLAPVDAQHPITVLLRAKAFTPPRTLERLDGASWTPLKTFLIGCGDIFESTTTKLGDFATVLPASAASGGGSSSGGGLPVPALVAGLTALIIVVLLLLVRLARSQAH